MLSLIRSIRSIGIQTENTSSTPDSVTIELCFKLCSKNVQYGSDGSSGLSWTRWALILFWAGHCWAWKASERSFGGQLDCNRLRGWLRILLSFISAAILSSLDKLWLWWLFQLAWLPVLHLGGSWRRFRCHEKFSSCSSKPSQSCFAWLESRFNYLIMRSTARCEFGSFSQKQTLPIDRSQYQVNSCLRKVWLHVASNCWIIANRISISINEAWYQQGRRARYGWKSELVQWK